MEGTGKKAIGRMRRALSEYFVGGIKTTLPLFRRIMHDAEFCAGRIDTGFLDAFEERRRKENPDPQTQQVASIAAALAFSKREKKKQQGPERSRKSAWAMAARR